MDAEEGRMGSVGMDPLVSAALSGMFNCDVSKTYGTRQGFQSWHWYFFLGDPGVVT